MSSGHHDGWVSEVLARIPGVSDVASALGLGVVQRGGGASITPCPSCGAEKRGKSDPRGPVGIKPTNDGWRCHRCDTSGDALGLVSWHLCGGRLKGMGERAGEIREWCAGRGWCSSAPKHGDHGAPATTPLAAPPAVPSPPLCPEIPRPPLRTVLDLWRIHTHQPIPGVHLGATKVTDDPAVSAWLRSRSIEPAAVAQFNLARAIPVDTALPGWARWRGPWTQTGHRVITPFFDKAGAPASLHSRTIDPAALRKALSPRGFAVAGLVMANAPGRAVLIAGTSAPSLPVPVLIVEGVPDYLVWATARPDLAIIGVISGSWSQAIAERIPAKSTVTIRTHADRAGDKYAHAICRTLADRCVVLRARAAQVIIRSSAPSPAPPPPRSTTLPTPGYPPTP